MIEKMFNNFHDILGSCELEGGNGINDWLHCCISVPSIIQKGANHFVVDILFSWANIWVKCLLLHIGFSWHTQVVFVWKAHGNVAWEWDD